MLAVCLPASLLGRAASLAVHAQAREEGRLLTASEVLEELRNSRDQAIPDRLLERAYGIAVIPDLTKVAFFAGGRHGHGVLVVRDSKGRFSNPVLHQHDRRQLRLAVGRAERPTSCWCSPPPKGVEGINGGKLTLGADASVAAGPVGRTASAATDQNFKAEVYSYSRSRGVFAGLALDGTVITIDDDANAAVLQEARRRRRGDHLRRGDQQRQRGAALHGRRGDQHRRAAHRRRHAPRRNRR